MTFRGSFSPKEEIKIKRREIPEDNEVTNRYAAMELADRRDKIYFGVFYEKTTVPTYSDLMGDVVKKAQAGDIPRIEDVLDDFSP